MFGRFQKRSALMTVLVVLTYAHCHLLADSPVDTVSVLDRLDIRRGPAINRYPDGIVLTSSKGNPTKAFTTDRYPTPLVISATAKTDSTNIRLFYGQGLVVLNWEAKESQLVHHDPKTGQQSGVADQGSVPINTWIHVRWIIDKNQSTIEVDGKQRASFSGDYAEMSEPVGIGTYGGATMVVTSMTVGRPAAVVNPVAPPSPAPAPLPDDNHVSVRKAPDTKPLKGPTTRIANRQISIKDLSVLSESSGAIGGRASDLILTLEPGNNSALVTAHFITPIGDQMAQAIDDALRYVHLRYPNWYANKAEFTFSDRAAHDDASIGAAVGALILSAIEGFQIDPKAAITGDVIANGSIHAIGALTFRIRGAVSAGCSIVAVPVRNYGNLVDAVNYKGPSIVSDVQIIGMSKLDDAVAIVRSDRDSKLAQAIVLFDDLEKILKDDPNSLYTPKAEKGLKDILNLAPNHLSASLLLLASERKLPKTLSPTASLYYTGVAVNVMVPILTDRQNFERQHPIPSSAVQQQLTDLNKLRPIADAKIQPLIDAWSRFIRSWSDLESGHGSAAGVDTQYQKLKDEWAKVQADPELNQKLLNEGM